MACMLTKAAQHQDSYCRCCWSMHANKPQARRKQRQIEKREWRKDQA